MKTSNPRDHSPKDEAAVAISEEDYSNVLEALNILDTIEDRNYRYIESRVAAAITPLLKSEGFDIDREKRTNDRGFDFAAHRGDEEGLVIEAKHYSRDKKISVSTVKELIGAATIGNYNRAILVSNSEFSSMAREMVRQELPLNVELMTYANLRDWASRLRESKSDVEVEVRILMQNLSRKCAELIAENEDALNQFEWRDMERIMAEVFDGLGFEAELTAGSKDGGKDIVLTWSVAGQKSKYYVEIKHWRSSTKVGSSAVQDLLNVVVSEKIDGGLFLSTYGYTANAFEQLTTIDREKLRFGDKDKIVKLCKTYVKAKSGLWAAPTDLLDIVQ